MSNAMRFGKRSLAGVAAGALALGALTIASAPAVSAAPSITPKAAVTAAVTPVRPTGTGAATISVPSAKMAWLGTGAASSTLTLTTAPSSAAILTADGAVDDTATLNQTGTITPTVGADDTGILINVDTAGQYAGSIANGTDTVSFSFTTRGAPTTMVLAPASSTVNQGVAVDMSVTLRDANGNITQPVTNDGVTVNDALVSASGNVSTGSFDGSASLALTGTDLFAGVVEFPYSNTTQGTYSITATPSGTLPSAGITAQQSFVLVSGAIDDSAIVAQAIVVPTNAINGPAGASPYFTTAQVPSGTSSISMAVQGQNANATVRFAVTPSAGAVDDAIAGTTKYIDVPLSNAATGVLSFTLSGAAISPLATATITQVDAGNDPTGFGSSMTVTQVSSATPTILVVPSSNLLAQLGQAVPVSVSVQGGFSAPLAGATVTAFRGSSTTPIASAVTGADGLASFTVTNASTAVSGTTETYSFSVQLPNGVIQSVAQTLIVTYTTSGQVTSLIAPTVPATVSVAGRVTEQPVITVPSAGVVDSARTSVAWNPATGQYFPSGNDGTDAGEWFQVTPLSSPGTNVTVTGSEGVKLLVSAPGPFTPVAWDGGSSTLVVPNGTPVYVFSTKTGSGSLTITPFGSTTQSVSVPFTVVNQGADAYTVTADPSKLTVDSVSFNTFVATVKDVFGNPVPGAVLFATVTGDVLLSGLSPDNLIGTGANGTATVSVLALRNQGTGKVTLDAFAADAAQPGYIPPVNAPTQPAVTATVDVTIQARADASIVIVGERGNVGGKTGIKVDGGSTGFVAGTEMTPMVRFPGETSYTAGSARPTTNAGGDFSWQRKTGKKTYVYFMSGSVNSNRIIIAAK